VKAFDFMNSTGVYLEIGQSSLKALDGDDGLELSLERQENGRLTPLCMERLTGSLRVFLKKHNWRPRLRVFCAVGARGVSLRRLSLPSSSKEEIQRLLPLQIEREFPLAPEELAWGARPLESAHASGNGAPAVQELLVAAVKREVLQEYSELLSGCGLNPVFTVAALARSSLCPQPPGSYAVLDIGRSHSELISFENGAPAAIRIVPWGGEDLTRAIEQGLAVSHAEAEKLKIHLDTESPASGERGPQIEAALEAELHSLARRLQSNWLGQKLYLTGASARLNNFTSRLSKAIGSRTECERLEVLPGEGRSAAIFGLKRSCEDEGASLPLILQLNSSRDSERVARPAHWKWAALAALLVVGALSLRYAEPLLQKGRLTRKLAEIKAYRQTLPKIDRELLFLQYLKTNQPPYLDPLFALANSAPAGARIETLSINRRGELSLRASMRDSQQVVDLRSKLIASGLFSSVVVEEQNPTPDRQKIVVRMSGVWKVGEPAKPVLEKTNAAMKTIKAVKTTNATE
jgi:type IV pilus assembly protein PilM